MHGAWWRWVVTGGWVEVCVGEGDSGRLPGRGGSPTVPGLPRRPAVPPLPQHTHTHTHTPPPPPPCQGTAGLRSSDAPPSFPPFKQVPGPTVMHRPHVHRGAGHGGGLRRRRGPEGCTCVCVSRCLSRPPPLPPPRCVARARAFRAAVAATGEPPHTHTPPRHPHTALPQAPAHASARRSPPPPPAA